MARITMRKVQETKLSEVFTLYLASAAARGGKDKTFRTYEQHFNAISKISGTNRFPKDTPPDFDFGRGRCLLSLMIDVRFSSLGAQILLL